MRSRHSNNSDDGQKDKDRSFLSLTRHLRARDFRWIKEDLALQDFSEGEDLQVSNDNQATQKN